MLKLEGRVALVTGASRGIGRAIALALAREGARVAVNYVESERLAAEVVEEVIGFGGEAVAVRADVASPREVDDLVGAVGDRLGAIDVLVNNASVVSFYALPDLELAEFDRIINTDLRSAFLCTKAVLPGMLARRGGRIINVSSTSGICGPPESAHYCASKGGVNTFTKACATDLRRYNITVNAICPGPTETDMLVPRLKAQGFEFDPPELVGPERRLGRAVDMAGVRSVLGVRRGVLGKRLVVRGRWRVNVCMSESNVDPTRLLADKVAIVTGGARGVGRAVAEVFVEAGASVAVVDVDEVELGAACRSLEKGRGNALPLAIDVSTIGAGEEIARECVERFGRLDVLVNNAAVQGPAGSVVEAGEADWERYLAVNLRGPSRLLRAVLPVMCDQGGGSVVNIASVSSYLALPRQAAYATSKAAILQLTRSVAIDFGRYGVRSNCVCPGPILSGPLLSRAESNNGEDDPVIESLVARHATGRLATPKDIAYAVLYLAGPYASQVTGAVLVVDGGFSIA